MEYDPCQCGSVCKVPEERAASAFWRSCAECRDARLLVCCEAEGNCLRVASPSDDCSVCACIVKADMQKKQVKSALIPQREESIHSPERVGVNKRMLAGGKHPVKERLK